VWFFVCFYVRIVYLRKRERAGPVPLYFFQRGRNSLLLPLALVYFQTERERKEREKTTEKVRRRGARLIPRANERSRFVFSRSLLSRLASVWFCIFSSPCPFMWSFSSRTRRDFKKSHRATYNTKTKNVVSYNTNPTRRPPLFLLTLSNDTTKQW
jgi:hypothetical protein